jgi:N-methylhydantoinase A
MINAIRQVTIERGHDPREFSLLCYGGGGGLFAGSLAQELQIPRAVIPFDPAVFSAWGILNSDFREDVVRTSVTSTEDLSGEELQRIFEELAKAGAARLQQSGIATKGLRFIRMIDMRYGGQEHTVRVPIPSGDEFLSGGLDSLRKRFDELHEQAYAHASPGTPTEVVNLRLWTIQETRKPTLIEIPEGSGDGSRAIKGQREVYFKQSDGTVQIPIYDRERLGSGDRFDGPGIVEEWSSTIVVFPGQALEVDRFGNLIIHAG